MFIRLCTFTNYSAHVIKQAITLQVSSRKFLHYDYSCLCLCIKNVKLILLCINILLPLSQIFFPDLIDKRKTPTYSLVSYVGSYILLTLLPKSTFPPIQKPCQDNRDFAILRFHGGPPYEVCSYIISFVQQ